MATRRPHTKSRQGCVRCKQKHLKCDEVRPTCGTCARYKTPCVVLSAEPSSTKSSRASSQTAKPRCISSNTRNTPRSSSAATSQSLPRSSLTLWEFELLHHWIINVADTFDISPGFHRAWRDEAIRAAIKYEFFNHMILILSALHMALTNSPRFTEKHREFILNGCSDAMAAFRKEAENITDENWQEVEAFPFLISVYGLALAQFDRAEKSEDTVLDETIHILLLIKANKTIAEKTDPVVDPKSKIRWMAEEDILIGPEGYQGDFDLVNAVKALQSWIDESGDEEGVRAMNTGAARMIAESVSLKLKLNLRPFAWPNLIEDNYLALLTARNPMALVILAHYAVILAQSKSQWWCANWGWRVVSVIASCLPDRFVPALEYPLQNLGLVSGNLR